MKLWVPRPRAFCEGGHDAADTMGLSCPAACIALTALITCTLSPIRAYQRRPLLDSPQARDCFLSVLEQTRQRYRFVVIGYVVMPEHVHLLITEPEVGTPSTVMQVLKQRTAQALWPKRKRCDPRQRELFREQGRRAFWQERFYDFNVWSTKKRVEKLRYMHRNPVKRGMMESPEQWHWSSYRHYLLDETGPVKVDAGWGEISFRDHVA
jgi:REP-associated tyrosine transposase